MRSSAHRRFFGSMASRSASPSRVKPSTTTMIAPAGQNASCGMGVDAGLRLAEHLAPLRLGGRPATRGRGRTAPRHPGSMSRPRGWPARSPARSSWAACAGTRSAPRLTPSARAASTWSDSRWASIWPRSNRANTGICGIADRDDHAGQVRVGEQHADRDRQQQAGNGQHHVDDPHDHRVHPATERTGHDARGPTRRPARSGWPRRRPAGSAGRRRSSGRTSPAPGCRRRAGSPAATARSHCGHGRSGRSAAGHPGRAGRSTAR